MILTFLGMTVPIPLENSEGVTEMVVLLTPEAGEALFSLGYLLIIFPVIGSGLVITLHSWAHFYRNRTFGSGAGATYNTTAQIYNISQALRYTPTAFENVMSLFSDLGGSSSSSSKKDGKGNIAIIVIILAIVSVAAGILTTYSIIRTTRRNHQLEMANRYDVNY